MRRSAGAGGGEDIRELGGDASQAGAAADGPEAREAASGPKRGERDAVVAGERDRGERSGQPGGVQQLGGRRSGRVAGVGRAREHRAAGVEQQVDGQVLVFAEDLDDELVEPGEDVPVDVAEVVAGGVGAKIFKLDRLAAAFGAAFAWELAGKDFFAEHIEPVEAGREFGRQQIFNRYGGWAGSGDEHRG